MFIINVNKNQFLMNCKRIERSLYVYQELNEMELGIVDQHLTTCKNCSLMLKKLEKSRLLLSQIQQAKPIPENFSGLTGVIMQAVESEKKVIKNWSITFLDTIFFRVSMVLVSVILVVAFISEQRLEQPSMSDSSQTAEVYLNASLKRKDWNYNSRRQAKGKSLYACLNEKSCTSAKVLKYKKVRI